MASWKIQRYATIGGNIALEALAHLCDVTSTEIAKLTSAGVSATHAPGCDLTMFAASGIRN